MAVNTWDGAVDTEWNDAGNWNTTGETDRVPTSADDVIIPDTSSLPNPTLSATGGNPKNVKSLEIQTNGTIVGGGIQIRVYGENASGFAVDNDGIISGNLNLEIKTPSATDIDLAGTSGNFNNLKLNDASCVATMKSDCILDGDLEIAAGELSTGTGGYGFSNLTVAGDVDIDAGAKLEGNASSGATVRLKNLTVNGTYSATGGETIITGETGAGRAVDIVGTFTHNSGTLSIQTPADTLLRWPSSSSAHHLRINDASCIARPTGDNKPLIGGNLTVSAGAFNTLEGGQNHALTVTGTVTLAAGDLFLNASEATIGGFSVTGDGEMTGTTHANGLIVLGNWRSAGSRFINADGLVVFKGTSGGTVAMNGAGSTGQGFYNIEFNISGQTYSVAEWDLTGIEGNLKVHSGTTLTTSASDYALTVEGHVNVAGTLTGNESTITFKSLKIMSTGTYSATNQTTTLTGEGDGTGGSANGFALYNTADGTFTHNNGMVAITTNTNTVVYGMEGDDTSGTGANAFNRLQIELTNAVYFVKLRPAAGTAHVIKGNVTVAEGILQTETDGHTLTIEGDVSIESGGTLGHADHDANDTFKSLTISSGGTCIGSEGTTTITGEAGSGYAVEVSGTYTPNGGTLKITTDANTFVKILDDVNHLIIEAATATRVYEWVNNTTIQGNLTVNAGRFAHYSPNFSLDVQGDCAVNNTGILDGGSGPIEMNSLTIASGGEYRATTGTTTITGENSGGNAIDIDGTFTHNKGTVKIDHDTTTNLDILGTSGTDLYNLIVDSDGTVNYNTTTIENNLTKLGSGLMRPTGDTGRNLTIKGTLLVQAGSFGRGANDTNTNTFGNIVVEGGTLILTGGGGSGKTIVDGSFRNVGGTITSH
jgi:hypothetical protein